MNRVLEWAFVPFVFVVAVRMLLNKIYGLALYDFRNIETVETYVLWICFAFALISLWHRFVREKCPECRATEPIFLGEEELERFVGKLKVHGRDGEGRTTTHYVSTTFARMKFHYSCSNPDCKWRWHTVGKREIT